MVVWAAMCVPRSAHSTPLLCDLHWLPVCFGVQFEVLVMSYKAFHALTLKHHACARAHAQTRAQTSSKLIYNPLLEHTFWNIIPPPEVRFAPLTHWPFGRPWRYGFATGSGNLVEVWSLWNNCIVGKLIDCTLLQAKFHGFHGFIGLYWFSYCSFAYSFLFALYCLFRQE